MPRLVTRLQDFGDAYDGQKMRAMVSVLEQQLARIRVDSTLGAHVEVGSFTVGVEDDVVLVDSSAGDVTVILPEISDTMIREKYEVEIVKYSFDYSVTVTPTGTDTILDEPDCVIEEQWTALNFRAAEGGNWVIV